MKHYYLLLLFITSAFSFAQLNPPAELQSYYSNVNFNLTGTNLYEDLASETIVKHTTFLSYADRHDYLYDADEDLTNPNNVILIYSGESRYEEEYLSGNNTYFNQTFNTEHVYPQSLIENTAIGDLHHLRSCDIDVNTSRGNDPFVSGSGNYGPTGNGWYPGDDWRGDVARMILYMNLRYNEPFTDVGTLALFLQWNAEDNVSAFEDNRNSVISAVQGNRNPFIDNPYLATLIWNGPTAENRWATASTSDFTTASIQLYPNPANSNTVSISTQWDLKIEIYNVLGKRVMVSQVTPNQNSINISSLKSGVYIVNIKSKNQSIIKKLIKQ